MKKGDKMYILSNGNQAPYGIDELIDVIPVAHIRKIQKAVKQYYNPPVLRLNGKDGQRMDFDWTYDGRTGKETLTGFIMQYRGE